MAGKIKELLHTGLFKYTIGLLGAISISFSNFHCMKCRIYSGIRKPYTSRIRNDILLCKDLKV